MDQKSTNQTKKKATKIRSFSNNSAFKRAMSQMDVKTGETVHVVLEDTTYTVERS